MSDIAFQRTSTMTIPLKSVPPPLCIITTVCQAHIATSSLPLKEAFMMATTFYQLYGSGNSSRVATQIHTLK